MVYAHYKSIHYCNKYYFESMGNSKLENVHQMVEQKLMPLQHLIYTDPVTRLTDIKHNL